MSKVKLGNVAQESNLKWNGSKLNVPVVGLEHLIPGEILFNKFDINTDNTFTKKFVKGQVLFGRRRAYQRKAAIAEFDGICSGDITVIEAIENKILSELLPFIIQSPEFFDYANKGSAGSLSPRVKWEYLADYEFELPSLEEQKSLAEKLWAAYRLKEGYKRLLTATDEMVKSQFVEMFGSLDNPKVEVKKLIDVVKSSGQYGSNAPAVQYEYGKPRYIRITDINDDGSLNNDIKGVAEIDEKYLLKHGDIIFARTGATVGKTYLHDSGLAVFAGYLIKYQMVEEIIKPRFLMVYTHSRPFYSWISKTMKVGAQPNISAMQYDSMPVLVPPIEAQNSFLTIVHQADKSKFELKQCIENIDKVIRSLING